MAVAVTAAFGIEGVLLAFVAVAFAFVVAVLVVLVDVVAMIRPPVSVVVTDKPFMIWTINQSESSVSRSNYSICNFSAYVISREPGWGAMDNRCIEMR